MWKMSTNWSPPSDPNFVGIKYAEPTGSMGFVHLATFIYHKNAPNVVKCTSPMDGMGILFISSSVTLGIWNSSEKNLDDQKKWFMISLQWGVPTFMIFFLLIMRNPQQSSRRTFEHEAVIQVGTNSIWAGPPCDKKSMGIQEARGPRRGLALVYEAHHDPLMKTLRPLEGSLGWGYPKLPMKKVVAKNPNLYRWLFFSKLLRLKILGERPRSKYIF